MIIDCASIYKEILEELKNKYQSCAPASLGILTFGNDKGSESYIKGISKTCKDIGIFVYTEILNRDITQRQFSQRVKHADLYYDGVILQLPIPKHLSIGQAFAFVSSKHDIDGFTRYSVFTPATAKGIMMLLDRLSIDYNSKNCVMIGRSKHIGRAVAKELLNRNCTTTICHSYTDDITYYTKHADIIISAVGIPGFIKPDMIKHGAFIIDVGVNEMENKIVGDVDLACAEIADITPVPGGIGLFTRVALISNLLSTR